jgi:hypothetical protein
MKDLAMTRDLRFEDLSPAAQRSAFEAVRMMLFAWVNDELDLRHGIVPLDRPSFAGWSGARSRDMEWVTEVHRFFESRFEFLDDRIAAIGELS